MMICPSCQSHNTRVWRTEPMSTGFQRIRKCMECKRKFTTIERYTGVAELRIRNRIKKSAMQKHSAPIDNSATTKMGISEL